MIDRIKNSFELVKVSARVLKADKELLIFPLVSGLAVFIVSLSFVLPILFVEGASALFTEGGGTAGLAPAAWVLGFLFYASQYFVIFFFNTALVGAAMIRLDGGDPSVGDGLRIAFGKIGPILGYAAIAATVGLLLRVIADRSEILGRMVAGLVGLAWNLATFLVVPTLVAQDVGPVEAIRSSAGLLKRTWGEQVAGNVGLGLAFMLIFLLLFALSVPAAILAAQTGEVAVVVGTVALILVAFLLLGLVQAALSGIYSAALYRFATTGDAGGPFPGTLVERAFVPR